MFSMKNNAFFLLFFTSIYAFKQIPSSDQVNEAVRDLVSMINKTRAILRKNVDLPLISGFLRLSFHDCVGKGSCDGCLNLEDPGNKGLETTVKILNTMYDSESKNTYGMSRADFYALAGWSALQVAPKRKQWRKEFLEITREEGLHFGFGRKDCVTSPNEADDDKDPEKFPGSCFSLQQSEEYFKKNFDFTRQQTVAIMGAHTLGLIRHGLPKKPKNKPEKWVRGGGCSSRFNNKLYRLMMKNNLVPRRQNGDEVCSWKGKGTFLDSDVSVAYEISRNDDGTISCAGCVNIDGVENTLEKCCNKAEGYNQVKAYRRNNRQFVYDFAKAYQKMLNHGYDDLVYVYYTEPAKQIKHELKGRQNRMKRKEMYYKRRNYEDN